MQTSASLAGAIGRGKMKSKPKTKAAKQEKMGDVMHEFRVGKLHSGSKTGPKVKSRKQAIAIGLSQSGQAKKKGKR